VEWLSNPNNQIDPNVAPPGLEGWDPVPYLAASLPISVSVFATQLAHEVSHRLVATLRKVGSQSRIPVLFQITLEATCLSVFATQLAHEVSHRLVATLRKVRLGLHMKCTSERDEICLCDATH